MADDSEELPSEVELSGHEVGDDGAAALAEMLEGNDKVTILRMDNCSVGDEGIISLADVFAQHPTLSQLFLNDNAIGDDGARAVLRAAQENTTICHVDLTGNEVSDDVLAELRVLLRPRASASPRPPGRREDSHKDEARLEEMLELIGDNEQSLTSVSLANCAIGNDGVKKLAKALKKNTVVREVVLSCTGMGNKGVEALAKMLKKNHTITSIDVSNNDFDNTGGQALLDVVRHNAQLTSVRAGNTAMDADMTGAVEGAPQSVAAAAGDGAGGDGAGGVANGPDGGDGGDTASPVKKKASAGLATGEVIERIASNDPAMSTVELSAIGNAGAEDLAAALDGNEYVTELHLASCKIGDKGIKALVPALKELGSLEELVLSNNRIRDAGGQALLDLLEANTSIAKLTIAGNPIGHSIQKKIDKLARARAKELEKKGGRKKKKKAPVAVPKPSVVSESEESEGDDDDESDLDSDLADELDDLDLDLSDDDDEPKAKEEFPFPELLKPGGRLELDDDDDDDDDDVGDLLQDDGLEAAIAKFEKYATIKAAPMREYRASVRIQKQSAFLAMLKKDTMKRVTEDPDSPFSKPDPLLPHIKPATEALLRAVANNHAKTQVVEVTGLRDDGAKLLADALRGNTVVTYVSVANCKLTDRGITALADVLASNSTVLSFFAGNNRISDVGGAALLDALTKNHTIKKVSVAANKMKYSLQREIEEIVKRRGKPAGSAGGAGGAGGGAADDAKKHKKKKKKLADKWKEPDVIMSLDTVVSLLYNNDRSLKRVSLSNIGDRGTAALAYALERNTRVTHLHLGNCRMGNKGARALAAAMSLNTSVKQLYLANNNIKQDGAKALLRCLKEDNETLTKISLAANPISYSLQCEIEELVNARKNVHEEEVDVPAEAQMDALCELLVNNDRKMVHVKLSGTHLGERDVEHLVTALSDNTHVQQLHLGGCKLKDKHMTALVPVFSKCKSLTHVFLANNKIGSEGAKLVLAEVKKNKRLKKVSLAGNPAPYALQSEIEQVCKARMEAKKKKRLKALREAEAAAEENGDEGEGSGGEEF